ncbi:MAG: hypothetical protein HY885_06925 [Deltaproteobacteria bacterium]|nr:hypothetical protein [Deltaproteobacteria bacterium]
MKKKAPLAIFTSPFILFFLTITISFAWGAPDRINYQGKLTDPAGVPLTGSYTMRFDLFDEESGGGKLWNPPNGETHAGVAVTDGMYNIELGSIQPLSSAVFASDTIWLEVAIFNSDTATWEILTPRQRITSTPFAFRSEDSETINGMTAGDFALTSHSHDASYALIVHNHDAAYVNEGQTNSINSSMVQDGSVRFEDLMDGTVLAEILDDDGPGSQLNGDYLDGYSEESFFNLSHNETVSGIPSLNGGASGITPPFYVDSTTLVANLNADLLDGLSSGSFVLASQDYGRNGVSASLYEGASTLTSLYVNEGQANSITSAMIVDGTVSAADLGVDSVTASEIAADAVTAEEIAANGVTASEIAAGAVGASEIADNSVGEAEIAWSLDDSAADLNGALLHLTNTSEATAGNYPMGLAGQTSGLPTSNPVIGVFGGSPGLGAGGPVASIPDDKVGVAGVSDTGYGVAGVSSSGTAIYGLSNGANGYGGFFEANGQYSRAVHAKNTYNDGTVYAALATTSTGVIGYHSSASYGWVGTSSYALYGQNGNTGGYGAYGYSYGTGGTGVYARASASDGTGLYAYGGSSGYAAHFRGKIKITDRSTDATVMELGAGLDYAEGFDVSEKVEVAPGTVLVIDADHPGKLRICNTPYDTKVAGIVAGANGIGSGVRLGADQFDNDVALAGRVFCNVDASRAAIKTGDLLTTSGLPGYAMKAQDHDRARGAILGKAMQNLEQGEKGQILVLVTLQ